MNQSEKAYLIFQIVPQCLCSSSSISCVSSSSSFSGSITRSLLHSVTPLPVDPAYLSLPLNQVYFLLRLSLDLRLFFLEIFQGY